VNLAEPLPDPGPRLPASARRRESWGEG